MVEFTWDDMDDYVVSINMLRPKQEYEINIRSSYGKFNLTIEDLSTNMIEVEDDFKSYKKLQKTVKKFSQGEIKFNFPKKKLILQLENNWIWKNDEPQNDYCRTDWFHECDQFLTASYLHFTLDISFDWKTNKFNFNIWDYNKDDDDCEIYKSLFRKKYSDVVYDLRTYMSDEFHIQINVPLKEDFFMLIGGAK